ncbi:hypothetical protein J2Y60_000042 [Arcicella sp. BE140]|nr:hypothetical protein [Arcicella sp. BE51]MDR6809861.1 hypothetical protein [Arcicella sp. BE140]MDR6821210.1 hypothetical protein [Arcicella sp. BE139]
MPPNWRLVGFLRPVMLVTLSAFSCESDYVFMELMGIKSFELFLALSNEP